MDCARKNRQLTDLTVLIKSLVSLTVCVTTSIVIISLISIVFPFFNENFSILFQANPFPKNTRNLQNVDTVITIHWHIFINVFPPVIEPNSVEVNSAPSTFNLCGSTNNNQVLVTCQVSIDDVSPAPTFSFSVDGRTFETPVPGTNRGTHYQRQFDLNPTVGGEYQVTCRVTNTVLPNTRHESQTTVIFRRKLIGEICSEVIVSDFMCWCL